MNKGVKQLKEENILIFEAKRRKKDNTWQLYSTFLAWKFCSRTYSSSIGKIIQEENYEYLIKTLSTA